MLDFKFQINIEFEQSYTLFVYIQPAREEWLLHLLPVNKENNSK